jgi:hypothetical protein
MIFAADFFEPDTFDLQVLALNLASSVGED